MLQRSSFLNAILTLTRWLHRLYEVVYDPHNPQFPKLHRQFYEAVEPKNLQAASYNYDNKPKNYINREIMNTKYVYSWRHFFMSYFDSRDNKCNVYWPIIFLNTRKIPDNVWLEPRFMLFFKELLIAASKSIADEYINLK